MSKQRALGTSFETSLIPLLDQYYPGAERRALHGKLDRGDFVLPGESRFILEAKNVRKMDLAGWLKEAHDEAFNAGVRAGVVVAKKRGTTNPLDQYAILDLGDLLWLANGR